MESVQLEHENVTRLVLVSLWDEVEEGQRILNEENDPFENALNYILNKLIFKLNLKNIYHDRCHFYLVVYRTYCCRNGAKTIKRLRLKDI